MADDNVKLSDPHNVPVTFCNQVVGQGHLNSVINLTFGAARFTPNEKEIDVDMVVAARLRMDVVCAQQLYAGLGELLKKMLPAAEEKLN